MLTNAGFDKLKHILQAKEEEATARYVQGELEQTRKAEIQSHGNTDQCPAVIERGSPEDLEDSFSFIDDAKGVTGKTNYDRTRAALSYGNIRPANYYKDDRKGRKYRTKEDGEAIANAAACWFCGDSTLHRTNKSVIKEGFRRLQSAFPEYVLPAGLKPEDVCHTCGRVLKMEVVS